MLLVGIAGQDGDFLLSLACLKCFLLQDGAISDRLNIILSQHFFVPDDSIPGKTREILDQIDSLKPEIVGFSCYVWNIHAVQCISDKIKRRHHNVKIIFGGPEIAKEDIAEGKCKAYCADYLIFGEGEKPFRALLRNLLRIKSLNLSQIKGLAYWNEGNFSCNSDPDIIEDLKGIKSPYLEGILDDVMLHRKNIRINIETQRGCSFRCAYCFYHKNFSGIRYRDSQLVIDEITYAHEKGIRKCRIVDANFLSNQSFAKTIILGLISRRIEMTLFCEILPMHVNEEIAGLLGQFIGMHPNNQITVGMGIQTTTQEPLRIIRRSIPIEFFNRAFQRLQDQNMLIKTDVILGLPRETKETYFEAIEYICDKMEKGNNSLSLAPLRVLPGTDMVEIGKAEKLTIDNRDSSHFVYETPSMPRRDMLSCLRINAAAFRLLSSGISLKRKNIRDIYFRYKNHYKLNNIEMLEYFSEKFNQVLEETDADYVKTDFPNAETYYQRQIHKDIPDDVIITLFIQKWGFFLMAGYLLYIGRVFLIRYIRQRLSGIWEKLINFK